MALSIPTSEPSELRAGAPWQSRREDLCDFPAPVWTLTYYFRNAAAFFDVVADADGDQFAVDVAKATTASQATGYYDWTAAVANGTERREIGRGSVVVVPDFSTAAVLDTRSNAKKLLDLVEAALDPFVHRVREKTPIEALLPLLSSGAAHEAMVVDEQRVLVGIITQTDLIAVLYRAHIVEAVVAGGG